MLPIAETKRLILREFQSEDAQDLFDLNNDPDVLKYTGDDPFPNVEAAQDFISNYSEYSENGYGRWAVIEKSTDRFVGWCGLKMNEENFVDLGFRFFKKEWGKGFATESSEAALNLGFTRFRIPEIIGRAAQANPASIRVLEKIGMMYWKQDACKGINEAVYYRINMRRYTRMFSKKNAGIKG